MDLAPNWIPFFILTSFSRASIQHWFVIDSGMNWGIIFYLLDTFFPFAHSARKTFKKQCFNNEFEWSYHLEKHDFWWFSWFRSLTVLSLIHEKCCIGCGSMFAPRWHQNQCFFVSIFWLFGDLNLIDFWTNNSKHKAKIYICSLLVWPYSAGGLFEGLLAPFRFHVGWFGYSFRSVFHFGSFWLNFWSFGFHFC